MECYLVYVTASSESEAATIGQTAVQERLAACANIFGQTTSIFWWENKLQTDLESVLILKTARHSLDALLKRLKEIHSYECPCILAVKVSHGNKEFFDFIEDVTS